VDFLDGLVANAALGHIDDPFKGKVVGGLRIRKAQGGAPAQAGKTDDFDSEIPF
jgi:hypothetical protein